LPQGDFQHHQIATDSLAIECFGLFLPVFDRSEAMDHLQGRERGVSELLGGCALAVRELLKSVEPLARR
jgi:hypothetical protein